jgi:ER membrane protein complex subunit 7
VAHLLDIKSVHHNNVVFDKSSTADWILAPKVSLVLCSRCSIVSSNAKFHNVRQTLAGLHSAAQVTTTSLEGRLEFVDKKPFDIPTRIALNNGEYTTYSRKDGTFVIFNVPPGIHQLDIFSKEYHFGQIKVQLLEESMDAPRCLEYAFPGAAKRPVKYPLVLNPKGTYQYFQTKRGFSIFSMLKNPMVLMMLFGVGMTVIMPKLMEGMDPEEKAKMREQMENQKDPTQMLSQMWGEITGSGGAEEEAAKSRKERRRVKN